MAPTFVFKLGTLDLSSYMRVNPDDPSPMDPYSPHFVEPAFAETPYADSQVLISTTVQNRETLWPLFLSDATHLKDALHALIALINNTVAQKPLTLEWRDDGASASTFFDVVFARFEPSYNFRRSQRGYAAGILHAYVAGYGHTGTTRIAATAAGTGIFLSVPIPSVAGDAPALIDTTITDGGVVPSLGRIVAVAPITNPSYTPRIGAASLTDLQTGATVVGASGADGSQYLALPVSPTGGASGIACKVPLPNPTIAGGDNRILAVVQSGIDAGVGMYALDPYGNAMGGTAVASTSQAYSIIDLGVCRLPTVGFPTQPKIAIYAGGIWASGAAGPAILASPAALRINEIFCLPDKNLTLLYERNAGASALSLAGFAGNGISLPGTNDDVGNPWEPAQNNANGGLSGTGANLQLQGGYLAQFLATGASSIDGDRIPAVSDSMVISGKAYFAFPASGYEEVRLFKDVRPSQFVQARLAASKFLALESATGGAVGNVLGSVAIGTLALGQKYRLALQLQGPGAFAYLTRDDGGPVFPAGASAAFASVGVASDAGVGGGGAPAVALSVASLTTVGGGGHPSPPGPRLYSWQVNTIGSSNLLPWDSYRIDGVNADSYRTSSAGVFAGQKLVGQQRGAFPKMAPSTTSVAVIAAAVDQGPGNDLISAVVSVKERFTYAR